MKHRRSWGKHAATRPRIIHAKRYQRYADVYHRKLSESLGRLFCLATFGTPDESGAWSTPEETP